MLMIQPCKRYALDVWQHSTWTPIPHSPWHSERELIFVCASQSIVSLVLPRARQYRRYRIMTMYGR